MSQRARARDKQAMATMQSKLPGLAERYGRAQETGAGAMAIKADLSAYLQSELGAAKNPYNPQAPAYRDTIAMTSASTEEEVAATARAQATTLGEAVFLMSTPAEPQSPRFVAGAVRLQTAVDGDHTPVKVIRID